VNGALFLQYETLKDDIIPEDNTAVEETINLFQRLEKMKLLMVQPTPFLH